MCICTRIVVWCCLVPCVWNVQLPAVVSRPQDVGWDKGNALSACFARTDHLFPRMLYSMFSLTHTLPLAGKHSAPDASEVPFALRWLAAELPGRAGRWMEAVSAFQALLGLCVTQSGIAEREGDAEASRLWGGRRARAAAALANVHAQ